MPMVLLRAPRGLLDEPRALPSIPPSTSPRGAPGCPCWQLRDVAGIDHYTIIMSPTGVAEVAAEIRAGLDVRLDKEVGS